MCGYDVCYLVLHVTEMFVNAASSSFCLKAIFSNEVIQMGSNIDLITFVKRSMREGNMPKLYTAYIWRTVCTRSKNSQGTFRADSCVKMFKEHLEQISMVINQSSRTKRLYKVLLR